MNNITNPKISQFHIDLKLDVFHHDRTLYNLMAVRVHFDQFHDLFYHGWWSFRVVGAVLYQLDVLVFAAEDFVEFLGVVVVDQLVFVTA